MLETDKHELQEELAGGTDQTESEKNQENGTPVEKPAKPIGEKRPVPDSEPVLDQGRDAELKGGLKPDQSHGPAPAPQAGETSEPENETPDTSASPPETPGAEVKASDTLESTIKTKPQETHDPAAEADASDTLESPSQSIPEKTQDPSAEEMTNQVQESATETKTEETPETASETTLPQTVEKPEIPETEEPSEKLEDPEETAEASDSDDSEDSEEDIDKTIAEDAEDTENQRRHQIPFLDYHALSMENLVGELQRLLRSEKVQSIRRHVEAIRKEFNLKFQEFIEEKKEEFTSRGGEASDFSYNSVTKRQFNELYSEYREQRNQYYKNLEKQLKQNLEERLSIIEQLKGLVSVEENMNSTYKSFKELQERWKKAGPVPRTQYNDVWRTYQHHLEIFYDFLSLNRELRDLDFKHNLGEKEKLSQRAEALLEEPDVNKAFRELQILHKIWKEDIGPVGKEHREAIWERFSEATRKMHDRRQGYFQELDKRYQGNLEEKQKIIARIEEVSSTVAKNHKAIQKQIREIETLRDQFFKAGKVPQKENEATWSAFKAAVRKFNRSKNAFYKNLKKEQHLNLDRKKSLLERATALKDSEDWDAVTPEMKNIQTPAQQ